MLERDPLASLAGIFRDSLRSLAKSISRPPLSYVNMRCSCLKAKC